MKLSIYNRGFIINKKHYIYNSFTNSLVKVEKSIYNKIQENQPNSLCQDIDLLIESGILLDKIENEFYELKASTHLQRYNGRSATFFIAPTLACNLDCSYCYEKDRRNKIFSKRNIEILKDYLFKFKEKRLNIVWYGGEPLLRFNDMVNIMSFLIEHQIAHSNSIITNGVLLDKSKVEMLMSIGSTHQIQITIDGFREMHNKRRYHKNNKKGTFDTILENIDALYEITNDIVVAFRVNIDKSNKGEFHNLSRYLYNRYRGKRCFVAPAFVFKTDNNYCNSAIDCIDTDIEKMIFYKSQIQNNNYNLNFFPSLNHGVCMARHISSFVIDPDLNFYKCPKDIGNKDKVVQNIKEKTINHQLLNEYLVGFDHLEDFKCVNCFYLPICGGGCYYNRKKGIETCSIYSKFLEEYINFHLNKLKN